jgi:predicted DNA-binding transcriptional regulator AlpA
LYKKVSEGTFPRPVLLGAGARAVGWIEFQVDHWLEALAVTPGCGKLEDQPEKTNV